MERPLKIELVPGTAHWSNVRNNVTRAQWEKCKKYARAQAGDVCSVCGGVGAKGRLDAHEEWHYDDEDQVQTLVDIVALCPTCHACKHLGRTREVLPAQYQWEAVINHFQRVNGFTDDETIRAVELAFEIWRLRSQVRWSLDVRWLQRELQIPVQTCEHGHTERCLRCPEGRAA